jgi:hypothetical protein
LHAMTAIDENFIDVRVVEHCDNPSLPAKHLRHSTSSELKWGLKT